MALALASHVALPQSHPRDEQLHHHEPPLAVTSQELERLRSGRGHAAPREVERAKFNVYKIYTSPKLVPTSLPEHSYLSESFCEIDQRDAREYTAVPVFRGDSIVFQKGPPAWWLLV